MIKNLFATTALQMTKNMCTIKRSYFEKKPDLLGVFLNKACN